METINLIQIDGKMPNLALMKLAKYHREKGDTLGYLVYEKRWKRWSFECRERSYFCSLCLKEIINALEILNKSTSHN